MSDLEQAARMFGATTGETVAPQQIASEPRTAHPLATKATPAAVSKPAADRREPGAGMYSSMQPKAEAKPEIAEEGEKPRERLLGQEEAAEAPAADPEAVQDIADAMAEDFGLDPADAINGEFAATAATLGLDKEGAAQLVELEAKNRIQYWDNQGSLWLAEAKSHPTFKADVGHANSVLRQYAEPELMEALATYRLENFGPLVRLLGKLGAELKRSAKA